MSGFGFSPKVIFHKLGGRFSCTDFVVPLIIERANVTIVWELWAVWRLQKIQHPKYTGRYRRLFLV